MILDGRPICVLGILDTKKGVEIANAMERWLCRVYDVHEVLHDGTQFELPALKEAQRVSMETGKPVLYLHTRGAVNTWDTTEQTHRMWRYVFGYNRYCATIMNEYTCACVVAPFIDNNGTHRYNGFVANTEAWKLANIPDHVEDRHEYEHLWRNVSGVCQIGVYVQARANKIKEIRKFLKENFA